jgi:hypothetical protein
MTYKPPPTEALVRRREVECWKLRCQGWTLQRIAEHLGLSREGVRKILRRIDARELAALSKHYEHTKIAQYHRLEHIIEEASLSWDRSKTPKKKVGQKTTDDGDGGTVTASEAIERDGDTSYLYAMMAAMTQQRSLLGLDVAPAPNETNWTITDIVKNMQERSRQRAERLAKEKESSAGRALPGPESQGLHGELSGGPRDAGPGGDDRTGA